MLLANVFSTYFIKSKPFYSNGHKSLPRNPHDYLVLDNSNFKALQNLETYVLVNNN